MHSSIGTDAGAATRSSSKLGNSAQGGAVAVLRVLADGCAAGVARVCTDALVHVLRPRLLALDDMDELATASTILREA